MKRTIYDIGANNGDDIPYYLMKADTVVAVEANPILCRQIRDRFRREVDSGKLVVEEVVVSPDIGDVEVDFWIHRTNDLLSQFPTPAPSSLAQFERRKLPSRPLVDLFRDHGVPHFVKLDVERLDVDLLRAMFLGGIRPKYISAECHSFDVFAVMCALGGYSSFKLVEGSTVASVYRSRRIQVWPGDSSVVYSFPFHSAGPFGDDVDGDWLSTERLAARLLIAGCGWKDVHATTESTPAVTAPPRLQELLYLLANRAMNGVRSRMKLRC